MRTVFFVCALLSGSVFSGCVPARGEETRPPVGGRDASSDATRDDETPMGDATVDAHGDAAAPNDAATVDAASVDATLTEDADVGDGLACESLREVCTVDANKSCGTLFGRPSARTGLPTDMCAPECACSGQLWTPPPLDDAYLEGLRSYVLASQPARLTENPYDTPNDHVPTPNKVCGLHFDANNARLYSLTTYDSKTAALEAGAKVTHFGACGLCSSLQDLAVYIGNPDLTEPVRSCGITGLTQGQEAQRDCIKAIGFSDACADIWSFNASNTRKACQLTCLNLLNAPYHNVDGSPNDCIQCDEDNSGQVFKAVAGRTRRNSGLPTALCRPCTEVQLVDHDYAR